MADTLKSSTTGVIPFTPTGTIPQVEKQFLFEIPSVSSVTFTKGLADSIGAYCTTYETLIDKDGNVLANDYSYMPGDSYIEEKTIINLDLT